MASYLDAGALVASGLAIGGFYARALPLSDAAIGLLLALQTFAFAVGAVVGGRLGDRVGRRRVLVVSIVLYAVGVAVLAAAWDTTTLAIGVVLSGLAIGGDLPTSLAMISEEAPTGSKGRLVAMSQFLWVVGIATVGALGFLLADLGVTAARLLYLHLLLVALVVLALRWHLKESREWTAARDGDRGELGPHSRNRKFSRGRSLAGIRGPTASTVLVLGLYYTAWNIGANTLGQFKPYLWIETMGGTPRGASVLILLGLPMGLMLSAAFVVVVDTPSRHRWIMGGTLTSLSGWLVVTVWPTREAFVYLVVSFAAGASMSGEVAYKVLTQQLIPTLSRATVQGATLAVARVAAALAAAVTPLVANESPRVLFGTVLFLSVLATALSARLLRLESRHTEALARASATRPN